MCNIFIHETAHVADGVKIGNGTKVWINVQIREDAVIGSNCILSKDVYIDHKVKIGNSVKVQNGVSIYNGVTIQDEVFIGPNVAFTNDYYPRAQNPEWLVTQTEVKKGASLGANSTIVCGNTIGEYAMVGAGSVVVNDVLPHNLVVGNPARVIGYVCKCGQRLIDNKCPKCSFVLE